MEQGAKNIDYESNRIKINNMQLLAGDPIKLLNRFNVYPFTIGDIKNIGGEQQLNLYLNVLTINKDMLAKSNSEHGDDAENTASLNSLTNLDIVILLSLGDVEFRDIFTEALSFVLREDVVFIDNVFSLKTGEMLSPEIFEQIRHVVKMQNCLIKPIGDEEDERPSNAKAKELLAKRKEAREKLKQAKAQANGGDGEPLTLDDLVSIFCANANGINLFNVWDLSFYAFNDQFNRMQMLDNYKINIQSLLAGADPDEIDLKHWMSKI